MLSYKPTIGEIRQGCEAILVLIIAAFIFKTCNLPVPKPTVRGTADSTFYWKNKYDQEVASQKATAAQFSLQDQRTSRMLDSVASIYNTQTKKIEELVIASINGHTSLPPVPGTSDTVWIPPDNPLCPPQIKSMSQTFESRWYTARAKIGDGSSLVLDTRDTLTAMWKTVKEGSIFNRKKYLQFDISLADTSRHITGLRTFRRLEQPKEFSVNLESSLFYLDRQIHPLVSMGLERTAGRFTAGIYGGKDLSAFSGTAGFLLSPWYGQAKLNFKLIKF